MDIKNIRYIKHLKKMVEIRSFLLIIGAAILLEVTSAIQFHYVRDKISADLQLRANNELEAKSLAIRNLLYTAESAVRNHVWDAQRLLDQPDSMYSVARRLVEQNPEIKGSAISFVQDYYPSKGHWFEPYAVRRNDGTIDTMQLGSKDHDYFWMEFFEAPYAKNGGHWSNPYLDSDGAQTRLTTFSYPVHDKTGKIAAIMDADVALGGIDSVLNVSYLFPSSYNILISRNGELMDYPDSLKEMHSTLNEAIANWNDTVMHRVADKMRRGERGMAVIEDNDGVKSHIFYAPVGGGADWSLAVVCDNKSIFHSLDEMRNKLLWLQGAGFIFLLVILFRSTRNINRINKLSIEKERIDSELNIAREIQLGMLPPPGQKEVIGSEVMGLGSLIPAKEVGGDLYDYYESDGKVFFCIGDVSGKGVPASLLMAVTRSLFRAVSSKGSSPADIISLINRYVLDTDRSNMFVTLFVGILDLSTGRLYYCNAGHDAPYILSEGKVEKLPVESNIPVGVIDDFSFEGQTVELPRKCSLFLYTDGLTEAMDKDHNQFGEERLVETLRKVEAADQLPAPQLLIDTMSKAVEEFVAGAEQSDDLTMLAIRYESHLTRNSDKNSNSKMLKIDSQLSEIPRLNRFVEESAVEAGLSEEKASELKLAVEEAVVNVISYAYPAGETGPVSIEIICTPEEAQVKIIDEGEEFDPTATDDVDISLDVDDRAIGGLGIHLVKQLTDSLEYRREDGKNILTLTKNR